MKKSKKKIDNQFSYFVKSRKIKKGGAGGATLDFDFIAKFLAKPQKKVKVSKMNYILVVLMILIGGMSQGHAEDLIDDEVETLEKLIDVNEKRLTAQKELKLKMSLFQKQKDEFLRGNESKSHAFSMVTNAREILTVIKQEHLAYLFRPDYLEELVFFSSIAGKTIPLRP